MLARVPSLCRVGCIFCRTHLCPWSTSRKEQAQPTSALKVAVYSYEKYDGQHLAPALKTHLGEENVKCIACRLVAETADLAGESRETLTYKHTRALSLAPHPRPFTVETRTLTRTRAQRQPRIQWQRDARLCASLSTTRRTQPASQTWQNWYQIANSIMRRCVYVYYCRTYYKAVPGGRGER